MEQEEQIQPSTLTIAGMVDSINSLFFIMRDENLNPHDIGPSDKERSKNHDGNGITRILEILP